MRRLSELANAWRLATSHVAAHRLHRRVLYTQVVPRSRIAPTLLLVAFMAALLLMLAIITPASGAATAPQEEPELTPTPTMFTPAPTSTAAPSCGLFWRPVTSPNFDVPASNYLNDVAVITSDNIWAVGYHTVPYRRIMILHYDGVQWEIVPAPETTGKFNILTSITALAPDDIWAVGSSYDATSSLALILHYDGTSWSIMPVSNLNPSGSSLGAITAISPTDIWAVGSQGPNTSTDTLALHWDGVEWETVPMPSPGTTLNLLYSISASSSNDIWVVGEQYTTPSGTLPLALHWDGTTWTLVPTPNPATFGYLYDVVALSPTDAWLVGKSTFHSLIAHWDGTEWVSIPNPVGQIVSELHGVAAASSDDLWAVGYYETGSQNSSSLTMHWDGAQWTLVPSPNPGGHNNELTAVELLDSAHIIAVGQISDAPRDHTRPEYYRTLVEVYSDPCASPTATGTPTTTFTPTSTSTATNTASTSTATSTSTSVTATGIPTHEPTYTPSATTTISCGRSDGTSPNCTATVVPCMIVFTDVPPQHTFYPFVRCMACRGIIEGYNTGCETGNPCFRPSLSITRGQLSKIVANAAGFTEPVGDQQFEDVLPGSTFFEPIWRLYDRNIVTGYPCGGVSEPCGSGDLPYFRPAGNATRGQISKIVANAAGLNDPAGAQLFEDVGPGSTFYDFIQRLANLDVVSGYPCGGAGEPCGPGSLSYFRPSANASRGQVAKIVSNTFFPWCDSAR